MKTLTFDSLPEKKERLPLEYVQPVVKKIVNDYFLVYVNPNPANMAFDVFFFPGDIYNIILQLPPGTQDLVKTALEEYSNGLHKALQINEIVSSHTRSAFNRETANRIKDTIWQRIHAIEVNLQQPIREFIVEKVMKRIERIEGIYK